MIGLKRQAVGAIVYYQHLFLLVHKVKIMDVERSPILIEGEWDFPKGGVKEHEKDLKQAILRELKEETGSSEYCVKKMFVEKLVFAFPPKFQKKTGFTEQETTIFLVEYKGNMNTLCPQDEEIDQVEFFTREEVIKKLHHKEMREFFIKYVKEHTKVE